MKVLNDMLVISTFCLLYLLQCWITFLHTSRHTTAWPTVLLYSTVPPSKWVMQPVPMVPASCRGILCYQQQPLNHLVQCGCMFTSCQAAIILQVHFTFDYIDKNGENQTHTVNNRCSWQMTRLFHISNQSNYWLHSILHAAWSH
jgi:hypothetical protein